MKPKKLLKAALFALAALSLATLGCGFFFNVKFTPKPTLSGESVTFTKGEEKYFSKGEVIVGFTYQGEDQLWLCRDNINGGACDSPYVIGLEDISSPGTILLFEGWSEMEEAPQPPLETDDA